MTSPASNLVERLNGSPTTPVEREAYNRLYQEFDKKCRVVNEQAARITEHEAEIARLRGALERFLWWGQQQCPCENEEPNPCTLCGASVENLEACKAVEAKFPPDILANARQALRGRQ